MGHSGPQLFMSLAMAAERHVDNFNVQELANVAWAFAISVQKYFLGLGCRPLPAGASPQMLCFLYSGERWAPAAVQGVTGDAFQPCTCIVHLYIVPVSVSQATQAGCLASISALKS